MKRQGKVEQTESNGNISNLINIAHFCPACKNFFQIHNMAMTNQFHGRDVSKTKQKMKLRGELGTFGKISKEKRGKRERKKRGEKEKGYLLLNLSSHVLLLNLLFI